MTSTPQGPGAPVAPARPGIAAAAVLRWRRLRAALTDAGSFRGWMIDANDGIIAAEREAEQRLVREESAELDADLHGEIEELAAHWQAKGLTAATARTVAEELTAHDALGAQLDAEFGIE